MRLWLTILLMGLITPALADHTSFYVVNRSPVTLMEVYATSVVNRRSWTRLAGIEVIDPGNRKLVRPVDNRGCFLMWLYVLWRAHRQPPQPQSVHHYRAIYDGSGGRCAEQVASGLTPIRTSTRRNNEVNARGLPSRNGRATGRFR